MLAVEMMLATVILVTSYYHFGNVYEVCREESQSVIVT
jgi:hypothetical protein